MDFPDDLHYASDREAKPLEFYLKCLRSSDRLDLKLGYFSSNAIRTLSLGFAQFIYKGGSIRIITNHYLSENDKKLLENNASGEFDYVYINRLIKNDLEGLEKVLRSTEQHFFDCLKYLLKNNRLVIRPVKLKPNKMAHYKEGIFKAGDEKVYFDGSCNFTYSGLIENGESISIKRSWGAEPEIAGIQNKEIELEKIFAKEHQAYEYLSAQQIEAVIKKEGQDKDLDELVSDEKQIIKNLREDNGIKNIFREEQKKYLEFLNKMKNEPRFPFNSEPYPYQIEAYEAWVQNGYNGIFAMATGTGKTITSLNCLLNEYRKAGFYRALILVPTLALVDQWKEEVELFNFSNINEVSGRTDWRKTLTRLKNDFMWDSSPNFVIISTYASFQNETFQKLVNKFPDDTFLIADEAHNIGAANTRSSISKITFTKKIALSATPKRAYDPEGNEVIEEIFNDKPPYCYNYSMEKAIKNGVLNRYFYYPILVELENDELEEYYNITSQLIKYLGDDGDNFLDDERVTALLIKRKNIIHKARGKLAAFRKLAKKLHKENKLKYCFVYVPEGYDYTDDEERAYYQIMMNILAEVNPRIRQSSFLGNDSDREAKLRGFKEGRIDALVAMKCLDEGVDVPRTEVGIFAASTGNPRQFIQRRGRLLRTHKDKDFAYIYDLVVTPDIYRDANGTQYYNVERALFKKELTRVAYFASLSENFYDTKQTFSDISEYFNLDVDSIIWELKDDA
ncbi:MAG: DEAD/DEAH box helicase family protein [Balneolaceae bacterium]